MNRTTRYHSGDKIGGRYQVHQALLGGMGEVYLCLDLETNLPYALKTFQQRYLAPSAKLRAAFESEVATWVALEKHPNIVRCYYMDILDNQPFMVLEWIAGEEGKGIDLRSWLRHGPLDLRTALDFTIDICRGLIHAQEKQPGIVHRDLKPENILIAQGRLAKITDFGLAQIVQRAELEATPGGESETKVRQSLLGQGSIMGTPPYMAPEQWRGELLDARTDIYAVGCILYEMLTGSYLFQATTLDGLWRQHLEADIPKLTKGALDMLLTRCLAKLREERFATVDDLLQQLEIMYRQQFGKSSKAAPAYEEFTAIDYNNRGFTYAKLQQHDNALVDFNKAIQFDPTLALAYTNRAVTYEKLKRYDEALEDHTKAIHMDPTFALAYTNRGVIYDRLERYNEAFVDFARAIQLDSALVQAYVSRSDTYIKLQCYGKALADLTQAIKLNPTDAQSYYNRGVIYHTLEYYDQALTDFSQAIQLDSIFAPALYNRGITFAKVQRYSEALSDFTQAIRLDPTHVDAYINRANTYCELGYYPKALADYDQAIQLDETNVDAFINRGNTYAKLKRDEDAVADFTCAIELDSTRSQAYNNRASAYMRLQRNDEALADYTTSLQLKPTDSKTYLNIGAVLVRQGKLSDAISYFERAKYYGDPQGAQYAEKVRQMLSNPKQPGFTAFQKTNTLNEMREAVEQFPFMTSSDFFVDVEQVIAEQVKPNLKPAYKQRLAWLRQITDEQKRKE